jgi:DNA-binding transcriptional LysR family regulator
MATITNRLGSLDDLLAFHYVAVFGGFTRAAEKTGQSKALLSRQVKRLESRLRTALFHRTTRSLQLTEAGSALLTYSHRISDLSAEAGRAARDLRADENSWIKISMPNSFGEFLGPSFLAGMRARHPELRIELDLANENRDFVKDEVDFALRAAGDHHPDLIARHLGRLKDVVCAAPALARTLGPLKDPRRLAEIDCILHSQREEWNQWTLSSADKDIRVKVRGRCGTNQYPVARALCLEGIGVARLPYYIAKEDLAAGRLVRLCETFQISTHPLYLVYLKSEYSSPRHTLTRDALLAWFQGKKDIFL